MAAEIPRTNRSPPPDPKGSAIASVREILDAAAGRPLAFFLDYDGTLTPIVARPELATIDDDTRRVIGELAQRHPAAIISGRDLADVRTLVGLPDLVYAGSHGFDIAGPGGLAFEHPAARAALPALDAAQHALDKALSRIPGSIVERKRFTIAAHYRNVDSARAAEVVREVDRVVREHFGLRRREGKMVAEVQPDVPWDKGRAVLWLLDVLNLRHAMPIYVGDDLTDEDAFTAIAGLGVGIRVGKVEGSTRATYWVKDPSAVVSLLQRLTEGH